MAGKKVPSSLFSEGGFFGDLLNKSEKVMGELRVRIGSEWSFSLEKGIGDLDFWGRSGAGIGTFCGLRGAGYIWRELTDWLREWVDFCNGVVEEWLQPGVDLDMCL